MIYKETFSNIEFRFSPINSLICTLLPLSNATHLLRTTILFIMFKNIVRYEIVFGVFFFISQKPKTKNNRNTK